MKGIKICTTFVLAFILLLTTLACPSEKGIRKAAKASARISSLTRDAIAATKKAYEGGLLGSGQTGLDRKNNMAIQLDKIIAGGEAFNAAVERVNAEYARTGKTDMSALQMLDAMLTNEVTAPFLEFLKLVGAISSQQAPYLWAAISALRTALLLIGSFVSKITVDRLNDAYNVLDNRALNTGGMRCLLV